jgi:DinB superfamily
MSHPLVDQLRFTRSEWVRGLEGVTAEEAARRFEPMNSIAWIIGHLAWQEQAYWLQRAQGRTVSTLAERCANGAPASTPPLAEVWAAWREVTAAADAYLDGLTSEALQVKWEREPTTETAGTKLLRTTYHYWYHLGEAQAIRQLLGHTNLPSFVGDISKTPYRPDR